MRKKTNAAARELPAPTQLRARLCLRCPQCSAHVRSLSFGLRNMFGPGSTGCVEFECGAQLSIAKSDSEEAWTDTWHVYSGCRNATKSAFGVTGEDGDDYE